MNNIKIKCTKKVKKMPRTDLRVIKTKEALHNSLLELIKDKPLDTISVSELCRKAKVNRGTFYFHYDKVEDVFEEYFKEIMSDFANSYFEPYRKASMIKISELNPKTIRIFHHIEKYKSFYRIVFSRNAPLTYYYLLFEEISKLLRNDIQHVKNIDEDILIAYQTNAILGMIIAWFKGDFQYDPNYMNQQLVKILNLERN